MPVITWEISIGNILTFLAILSYLAGGFKAYYDLKGDVRVMRYDIAQVKTSNELLASATKSMSDLLTKIAVQETRMNNLETQIQELKHGDGFVLNIGNARRPPK